MLTICADGRQRCRHVNETSMIFSSTAPLYPHRSYVIVNNQPYQIWLMFRRRRVFSGADGLTNQRTRECTREWAVKRELFGDCPSDLMYI